MKKCKNCNLIIPDNKVYCDSECMTIDYNKNKIKIKCIVCGNEKLKPKSQEGYKYCSQDCYHKTKVGKKRPDHSIKMAGNTFRKNKALTEQQRLNLKGENNHRWKGGITPLYSKIRKLFEYSIWRSSVYQRDNFICQSCFKENQRLECHHIKGFSKIISEFKIKNIQNAIDCKALWDINNGKTLCKNCHKHTDSYGKN